MTKKLWSMLAGDGGIRLLAAVGSLAVSGAIFSIALFVSIMKADLAWPGVVISLPLIIMANFIATMQDKASGLMAAPATALAIAGLTGLFAAGLADELSVLREFALVTGNPCVDFAMFTLSAALIGWLIGFIAKIEPKIVSSI